MKYFDYNSTSPVHPKIREKISEWLEEYGNPSSQHGIGRKASARLNEARQSILSALNLESYHLTFTSGGTESNHLAFQFLKTSVPKRKKIFLSSIEHPCIIKQKDVLSRIGYNIIIIPAEKNGQVNLNFLEDHLDEDTALCAVMGANNETGVIQDISKISELCREYEIHYHCDVSQIPGKARIDLEKADADSYTFSSHKVYSLKGHGFLVWRTKPSPLFSGGMQENELRAGTENLLGALAAETAFSESANSLNQTLEKNLRQRRLLEKALEKLGVEIAGKESERLSNTVCALIPGIQNEETVSFLDKNGYCISKGAACHSGVWEPSSVLLSMGYSAETAWTGVRISFGMFNSDEDVAGLAEKFGELILDKNRKT
ncbi:MAG TPA: cysteine desulfurase family protein [Leptospiraceae bacterium]|nr:cysteine desulfurase family protein [Leptospiraceae bacterium]